MKEKEPKKEMLANLRSLSPKDLQSRLEEVSEELYSLNFKRKGGQLDKPGSVKYTRRLLARIKTIQHQAKTAGKIEETS